MSKPLDPLAFFRGFGYGVVFSTAIWAVLAGLAVFFITR